MSQIWHVSKLAFMVSLCKILAKSVHGKGVLRTIKRGELTLEHPAYNPHVGGNRNFTAKE